jgi:hypothetical protein
LIFILLNLGAMIVYESNSAKTQCISAIKTMFSNINPLSFGYCIVLSLVLQLFLITPLLSSNIFYGHCIIFFVDLRLLITPLVSPNISCGPCIIFSVDVNQRRK